MSQPLDDELYNRILLTHRFGVEKLDTAYKGILYSMEDLPFEKAVTELKFSFTQFMSNKDHIDKLLNLLRQGLSAKLNKFSIKDSNILIHQINALLLNFYTPDYLASIPSLLAEHKIVVIPLKTRHPAPNGISYAIKGIVLFNERLIKISGESAHKMPSLRVYRVHSYDRAKMNEIINTFLNSFQNPLDINTWDKELNELTAAEKLRHITKKEQSVGNGAWVTCKLIVFSIVFATVFKFCKAEGLKDLEIVPLALFVAEGWYKLFIVDDRNRAVQTYLDSHHFREFDEPLSVRARVESLKFFLKSLPRSSTNVDKELLSEIYVKSLNWLLADHLKKGDIGEAYALIEEEATTQKWNPLFFAAKNGKIAIAELLASNSRYVNDINSEDNTPLHYAARHGHYAICALFVKYKAKNHLELLAQNSRGNTAAHLAIYHSHLDILDLLVKQEPRLLQSKNNNAQSLLKLACDQENKGAIERLLGKGASITADIEIEKYPEEIQKALKHPPRLLS